MADDHQHDHSHDHSHAHGHENDQGIRGALRYLRWLPQLWRSSINDAVVALIDPQPGERVLDIGAGVGAGSVPAARRGATVTAVEPTPFLRRILSARRTIGRHRGIEPVDGTAERLPVADGSIDAIWAVNTMHHWVDVERGADEIARVLAPGGRVLLVDELLTDPAHPDHARFGRDHGPEHHGFTMVDADEMVALLRAAGLVDVERSTDPIDGRPVVGVSARGSAPVS